MYNVAMIQQYGVIEPHMTWYPAAHMRMHDKALKVPYNKRVSYKWGGGTLIFLIAPSPLPLKKDCNQTLKDGSITF